MNGSITWMTVASFWGLVLSANVAAETALYRATFDVTWSSATHQSPPNPHFSGPIGATHSDRVVFWEPGQLASPGIQEMAEKGSRPMLISEVQDAIAAGTANAVVSFCCTLNSPGIETTSFSVDSDFSLVSLVTMIAPSPDWFVGVHDLDLHPGDAWQGKVVVDLLPYDAGTDDGLTFLGADLPAQPHVPIRRIIENPFPTDLPLGTLTFLRVLDGDFSQDGELNAADIDLLSAAVHNASTDLRWDVNKDRVVDGADRSNWVHDLRKTHFGDANLDGRFDASDLVEVFTVGQYEDEVVSNSTWAGGDWDGDGDFSSADLIVALADGGYGQTPRTATLGRVVAVPEPSTLAMLFAAAGLLVRMKRVTR